jgi:hypothetical protein
MYFSRAGSSKGDVSSGVGAVCCRKIAGMELDIGLVEQIRGKQSGKSRSAVRWNDEYLLSFG